jgi:hypothetical protein
MLRRALRLAFVLFQALWLNVIVPGHQRGAVALPGEPCRACEPQATTAGPCCDDAPARRNPDQPHRDPARHCAICYFAARVLPPVVVDLTPPPLRLLEVRPVPAPPIRILIPFHPTYDGRGPPPFA